MGLFITLEGPDGSGKSTQARLLAEALRARGHDVVATREPGGTPVGERLRTLILDPASPAATPLVMALMYSAARAELVAEVIGPALAEGRTVIADRYADSTAAYQGAGLGVPAESIDALRRIATGGLQPDITVYVDIEPEVGAERMDRRGAHDRLDSKGLDFHRRVREAYQQMVAAEPDRWLSVCGSAPERTVHEEILSKLLPRLEERGRA